MVGSYPLVPLWQAHGVGVALFSYAGTVYWGFNADYDIVNDVDRFATAIAEALDELHDAAMKAPAAAATSKKAKSPRKAKSPKKRPLLGAASPAAKKPAAKKPAATKSAAKKPAAKKPAAKKPAASK
jgi:hypothetical protein